MFKSAGIDIDSKKTRRKPKNCNNNALNTFASADFRFDQAQVGKNGIKRCRNRKKDAKNLGAGGAYQTPKKIQDRCKKQKNTDSSGLGLDFERKVNCFINPGVSANRKRKTCPQTYNWD